MFRLWFFATSRRFLELSWLLALLLAGPVAGEQAEGLSVRADVASGHYLVGQSFELRVSVVASGERPKVDPPEIAGAVLWLIGTEIKPLLASGIGAVLAEENLFLTRFRVVASRPGTLEVPAIRAQVGQRKGRSRPIRVSIRPVPLLGRPAEFLGGVGQFTVQAQTTARVVRVGQELEYRIRVDGPAARGMTARPELARLAGLSIGLRIEPEPDLTSDEPPARTFVYRLRPTRPGEAVLPPVAIAAYDPALLRYVTRVTSGVPVRVVAVPSFDPATIEGAAAVRGPDRPAWLPWAAGGFSATLLLGAFAMLILVRRGRFRGAALGPRAARRFAARLARALASSGPRPEERGGSLPAQVPADAFGHSRRDVAHRVSGELVRYLELGTARPPGAITPDEARDGVVELTGSLDLGGQAARLTALCDFALYGDARHAERSSSAQELLEDARGLFAALGRAKTPPLRVP
jgi:hypothetical protein